MITKFKMFEELDLGGFDVGCYVICHLGTPGYYLDNEIVSNEFFDTNIGKIIEIEYPNDNEENFDDITVVVEYNNATEFIMKKYSESKHKCIIYFNYNDIKHWSEDKLDLELELSTNKFNL